MLTYPGLFFYGVCALLVQTLQDCVDFSIFQGSLRSLADGRTETYSVATENLDFAVNWTGGVTVQCQGTDLVVVTQDTTMFESVFQQEFPTLATLYNTCTGSSNYYAGVVDQIFSANLMTNSYSLNFPYETNKTRFAVVFFTVYSTFYKCNLALRPTSPTQAQPQYHQLLTSFIQAVIAAYYNSIVSSYPLNALPSITWTDNYLHFPLAPRLYDAREISGCVLYLLATSYYNYSGSSPGYYNSGGNYAWGALLGNLSRSAGPQSLGVQVSNVQQSSPMTVTLIDSGAQFSSIGYPGSNFNVVYVKLDLVLPSERLSSLGPLTETSGNANTASTSIGTGGTGYTVIDSTAVKLRQNPTTVTNSLLSLSAFYDQFYLVECALVNLPNLQAVSMILPIYNSIHLPTYQAQQVLSLVSSNASPVNWDDYPTSDVALDSSGSYSYVTIPADRGAFIVVSTTLNDFYHCKVFGAFGTCVQCQKGYYWYEQNCYSSPSALFGTVISPTLPYTLFRCAQNCLTCASITTCSHCANGFVLNHSGHCVPRKESNLVCAAGTYTTYIGLLEVASMPRGSAITVPCPLPHYDEGVLTIQCHYDATLGAFLQTGNECQLSDCALESATRAIRSATPSTAAAVFASEIYQLGPFSGAQTPNVAQYSPLLKAIAENLESNPATVLDVPTTTSILTFVLGLATSDAQQLPARSMSALNSQVHRIAHHTFSTSQLGALSVGSPSASNTVPVSSGLGRVTAQASMYANTFHGTSPASLDVNSAADLSAAFGADASRYYIVGDAAIRLSDFALEHSQQFNATNIQVPGNAFAPLSSRIFMYAYSNAVVLSSSSSSAVLSGARVVYRSLHSMSDPSFTPLYDYASATCYGMDAEDQWHDLGLAQSAFGAGGFSSRVYYCEQEAAYSMSVVGQTSALGAADGMELGCVARKMVLLVSLGAVLVGCFLF